MPWKATRVTTGKVYTIKHETGSFKEAFAISSSCSDNRCGAARPISVLAMARRCVIGAAGLVLAG
jgi:hypothetical protein